jgi:DnaJ-class molecular chaperone
MKSSVFTSLAVAAASCLLAVSSLSAAAEGAKWGADRHIARGMTCQMCHGDDMKNPQYPEEATCLKCHQKDALAEKTKNLPGANPHKAPHNGDCTLCHMQHEEPVNYCAQCHKFDFKVK